MQQTIFYFNYRSFPQCEDAIKIWLGQAQFKKKHPAMQVGIISDTHSFFDPNLPDIFADVDEIWHAGDFGTIEVADQLAEIKPLRGVFGNIDDTKLRGRFPEDLFFSINEVDVWITHIAGRPGRYNKRIKQRLKEAPPHLLVCGHSHILGMERDPKFNDMLYLNPGAAGKQGFHHKRTLVKCRIENGRVGEFRIIELGTR